MKIITLAQDLLTHQAHMIYDLKKEHNVNNIGLIRITSRPCDIINISPINNPFDATLTLHFTERITEPVEESGDTYYPFTENHAANIASFFKNIQHYDTLYIHCEAGVCRSVSIGEAIQNYDPTVDLRHICGDIDTSDLRIVKMLTDALNTVYKP